MAKISANTIIKSIFWLLLSIAFGQIQLWIVLGSTSLSISNSILTYDKVILDGYVLFFCTSVTAALALDYYFEHKMAKRDDQILYTLFPIAVLLVGAMIGSNILGKDANQINLIGVKRFHYWLIAMTAIYVITIKYKEFKKI